MSRRVRFINFPLRLFDKVGKNALISHWACLIGEMENGILLEIFPTDGGSLGGLVGRNELRVSSPPDLANRKGEFKSGIFGQKPTEKKDDEIIGIAKKIIETYPIYNLGGGDLVNLALLRIPGASAFSLGEKIQKFSGINCQDFVNLLAAEITEVAIPDVLDKPVIGKATKAIISWAGKIPLLGKWVTKAPGEEEAGPETETVVTVADLYNTLASFGNKTKTEDTEVFVATTDIDTEAAKISPSTTLDIKNLLPKDQPVEEVPVTGELEKVGVAIGVEEHPAYAVAGIALPKDFLDLSEEQQTKVLEAEILVGDKIEES